MDKKFLLTLSVVIFSFSFLFQSCVTKRNLVYFSNLPDSTLYREAITNQTEPVIQPNDLLNIKVATLSPDANILFNSGSLPMNNAQTGISQSADVAAVQGYLVDQNGQIDFPVLGKITLGGLTREQARNMIAAEVAKTAKDPIVNIQIVNFKVTVIGEVAKPGMFSIANNKVNVLEALGMAGDMTPYAVRENVLIIHEKDGVRSTERLNLTDKNIFNSPFFYLQQNDIVYVQPENRLKAKQADPSRLQIWSLILSTISVLVVSIYYIAHSK
ncbi:MAG TPA: polysaccharide biosynthesis/export family protein [Arachidicoccus sp.]